MRLILASFLASLLAFIAGVVALFWRGITWRWK